MKLVQVIFTLHINFEGKLIELHSRRTESSPPLHTGIYYSLKLEVIYKRSPFGVSGRHILPYFKGS